MSVGPVVERLARRLAQQTVLEEMRRRGGGGAVTWGGLDEQARVLLGVAVEASWPSHIAEAVELLEALREPTPAMLQAAEPGFAPGDVWRLMIDAAAEGGA